MRRCCLALAICCGIAHADEPPPPDHRAGDLGVWHVAHLEPTPQLEAEYSDPIEVQKIYDLLYDNKITGQRFLDFFWPNPTTPVHKRIERLERRWRNASHKPLIYRQAILRQGNEFQLGWWAFLVVTYERHDADNPATADIIFARSDAGSTRFMVEPLDVALRDSLLSDGLQYIDHRHLRESRNIRELERARAKKKRIAVRRKLVNETYGGLIQHYRENESEPGLIMAAEEEFSMQRAGAIPRSFPQLRRHYGISLHAPPVYFSCNAIWTVDVKTSIGVLELYLASLYTGERKYYIAAGDDTIRRQLTTADEQNQKLAGMWPYGKEQTRITVLGMGKVKSTFDGIPRDYLFFLVRAQSPDDPYNKSLAYDVHFLRETALGYRVTTEPEHLLAARIFTTAGLSLPSGPAKDVLENLSESSLPPSFGKLD